MREIDLDEQRKHSTPFGQRSSSSACRHSASVSKSVFRLLNEFFALMVIAMPKKKKTANQMTDAELAKKVFPPSVRKQLKTVLFELENRPKRKQPQRKSR